jgi:XTP/dITP diphosphohydrolase
MSKLGGGKFVIATHNAGKLKEIAALLAPYGLECLSAGSLGLPEPAETGTSFTENALIKARAAAEASGLPALADDSGLCVNALQGRPGVYTADWAERQSFEGDPGRDWYIACVLALAWPDCATAVYEGRIAGTLTWPPRGKLGFGYDPVFVPDGHTQTFAELPPEEKHRISHRADAFAKLVADQFGPE